MATDLSVLTEEEILALEQEGNIEPVPEPEPEPEPVPEPELLAKPLVGLAKPAQEVVEELAEEAPATQQYYELELPDFSFVNVPVGTSEEDALRGARASFPEAFASESVEEEKEGGFFSSLYGGLIGSIESIPGGAQAVYGGVTGDSEVFEGAKARVARAEEAARQATGKVITLDDVSKAYDDDGLISATAKWLGLAAETTGQSIGYMAPSMVGGFMLGRMGTVAGAMLGGPLGAAVGAGAGTLLGRGLGALNTSAKAYKAASIGLSVGRTVGYTGTQVSNFLASNLSRSVEAAEARGEELTENDYNVLGELSIAGGQTALESMMVLLAGGSLALGAGAKVAVGKAALTPPGKRVLMESLANQINKIDNLSPIKRFVATMVEETVAEVGQQALERLSAGESISPTEEDALQEYIQTALMAIGPSMFFGGVGAVNAKVQQSKQIKHDESIEQARDDMLLVQKGLAKQAEEEQASQLEEAAVAQRDSFLQRVLPSVLGGRDESDPGGRTTEDVHNAARSRNINSEDAGFHSFTRRLVGKSKLDELTPSELEEVYQVLELMPVQKLPISFPVASKDDAVKIAKALDKPTLTDENLLNALDKAGLLNVDRRYVTKQDLAEIADSYRNRLNELGLVEPKSGVIGPTINLEKAEALSAAIASPKVKRTIPQAAYEAVIKYAGLENEGYFPSWEKFSELTGVLNTDFYELAIAEAVARGDVAGDGTLRITHPATPSERKRKYSVYVKVGGERRSIGVFNTETEAEAAAKAYRADAAATRKRGQGPAGVPELSIAEVGNVYPMNVINEMLPTVGDSTARSEPEMVERYDYDVRERDEWVVKDKQGNLLGAYPTRQQAVDKVNEVKKASPNKRKANVKNPSKETVYRVHESEVGGTSKRSTRSRQVGTESYLVKSGAEAKANQLRDKASGAARFYGTQANDDTAGLRGDDVLTPEEITELTNDPVGFAEKRFPVQDVVYGPEENPVKVKLLASVNKFLSEVRGLKNIQVAVVDTIDGDSNAQYNSVLELMTVALDGEAFQTDLPLEQQINEVNRFVNHELIHYALRAGLISNGEYQVLVRLAAGTEMEPGILAKVNRDRAADGLEPISADTTYDELAEGIYGEQAKNEGWIPDDMSEESIAFMAQDYGDDRSSVPAEAGTIFRRIGLGLSKLRNALQGAGFRSSDQVYSVLFGKEFANRLTSSKIRDAYWYRRRNSPEYKELVAKIVENRGTLTPETERRLTRAGVFDPVPFVPLPVALDAGEEAESTARQSKNRAISADPVSKEAAEEAALTQSNGKSESVMEQITRNDHMPGPVINVLMNIGDLSHRVQSDQIQDAFFKLKYYLLDYVGGGFKPNGESFAGWLDKRVEANALFNGAKTESDIKLSRDKLYADMSRFADAHENTNKPITRMGQLSKDIAIALGRRDFAKMFRLGNELDSEFELYRSAPSAEVAERIRLTPSSTARKSLTRQKFKRDPAQDNMASPLDKDKPTLPPYKPVPESRDPQKLMNALSWGNVRFNGNGQYSGKGPGLRVFIAAGSEASSGERHIERHNQDIADNTPYSNAEEFLTGFFDALKSAPKNLEGSYITPYYDAFGRKMNFFWDDPGFSSPGVVVMEYADGPGTYLDGPRYNVITAYADNNFTENAQNESFASGVRRGKYADVRSVMEFERYSQGKRGKEFIKNRERINEAKGFTGRRSVNRRSVNTPAQQKAVDAYMGTGRMAQPVYNKSYLGSIISGLTQNYSIPFWEEFRARMVDQYDGVAVNESAANRKKRADGKLGLTIPQMAAMSAHSMMMMTDKAGAFVEAMLKYGTIDFTGLAGQEWMYGTVTVNEMEMDNSVEDALVFVPGEGIKKVSFNEPNLYSGTGGLIKVLSSINSMNDSLLEKYFTYARSVRAFNKVKEGKPVPVQFLGDNMEQALQLGYDHPEIAIAHANLQKWNDSLITFAVKSGVLNDQQADIWRQYADYVPFYLDTTGEMSDEMRARFKTALGSSDDFKMLNSMLPKAPSKKYKGMAEGELVDPIEATIRNTMAMVSESMKNIASWRFIKNMEVTGDARRLDPNSKSDNEITGNVVTVYENGKSVRFEVTDIFLHDTMVGAFEADKALGSITSAMSIPAKLLREGVTRMPDFLLANTTRDAFLSWLLHKTSSDPVSATADSMKRILSDVKNREQGGGATQRAIEMGGGSGGYELRDLDLDRMKKRMDRRLSSSSSPVDALKKTWDFLGDVGNFSESAARQRVFERTYARTQLEFQQQGKEAGLTGDALTKYADRHATGEAAFQAMEVLNFARRGNAPLLRFLTAVVPFLNARIQGLDVFYRNGLLGENSQGLDNDIAKRALMRRASYVAAATLLYTLMHYDDDDFENTEEYRRLDNWLIPLGPLATERQKFLAIPIPFEAGILLKVLPEALIRNAMGESTGEGLRAVKHSIMNTLAFNPIPQALKPMVEIWANKNSFTGQPIIPQYMLKLDPAEQYRESTSGGAKILGKMSGFSPLQIDSFMKGYMGSSVNYINAMLDLVIHRPAFGLTERPETLVSDMPFIKRFLVDDLGGGNAEDFYRFRDEVDRVVNTVNILKKRDPSRVESYVKSNREVLAARNYAREIGKALSRIRDRRNLIMSSSMSRSEKARLLTELRRIEIEVMSKPPKI